MAALIVGRAISMLASIIPSSAKWGLMLLSYLVTPYTTGTGSVFNSPEVDKYNVGGLACVSHGKPPPAARNLIRRGLYVAHQKLPCYQLIHLCVTRNGRCTFAVVADRGPLHMDIDIYKNLADVLKHNGLEEVKWKKVAVKDGEVKRGG